MQVLTTEGMIPHIHVAVIESLPSTQDVPRAPINTEYPIIAPAPSQSIDSLTPDQNVPLSISPNEIVSRCSLRIVTASMSADHVGPLSARQNVRLIRTVDRAERPEGGDNLS